MSSWICGPAHIAFVVLGAELTGQVTPGESGKLAGKLLRANIKGVRDRYPHDTDKELPGWRARRVLPVHFKWARDYLIAGFDAKYRPAYFNQAIGCLIYQSCDAEDWDGSWAQVYLDGLRTHFHEQLGVRPPWDFAAEIEEWRKA